MEVTTSQLAQRWIHSREEDSGKSLVYRGEDFDFPPARGRDGFLLHDDGTMQREGPGADDRVAQSPGTWEIQQGNHLVLQSPAGNRSQVYEIAEVSRDRLVLKAVSSG
jgi:hypothetical protein